jgi:hypothetical protein
MLNDRRIGTNGMKNLCQNNKVGDLQIHIWQVAQAPASRLAIFAYIRQQSSARSVLYVE